MGGSWRNFPHAKQLSQSGTEFTYQGELVHGGTLFKRKIPSVAIKQENINYGEEREGKETGTWEGREMKDRFHFEFRPETQQERAEFQAEALGLGERTELSTVERGTD